MAQLVLSYKKSVNTKNMIDLLVASGLFTVVSETKEDKFKREYKKALTESKVLSERIRKDGGKGLKTLDELLSDQG